jgi:large subunit ribosomal protein L17
MRHLKSGRKLGRIRKQRRALFKTMLGSLVMNEKIRTTEAKAKEIKVKIDPIINKAKKAQDEKSKITVTRGLERYLPKIAIGKLKGDFIKKFEKRNSGYTRVIKLERRKGDGSKMAVVEFVY